MFFDSLLSVREKIIQQKKKIYSTQKFMKMSEFSININTVKILIASEIFNNSHIFSEIFIVHIKNIKMHQNV